jgi:hypothetical protein
MSAAGYVFMALGWAVIIGLTIFCYKRILWG